MQMFWWSIITLPSTYRISELSTLEYLKKFFYTIVKGRKDYELASNFDV